MSRGGRGGFGRGGFGSRNELPFELDPTLKPDFTPSELFPPNPPPVQSALSRSERLYITRFREFRDQVANGPFYTVLGKRKGMENPFEDIERYSRKFEKKRRKVPKLDARPYVFEFFPPELYPTMDPTKSTTDIPNGKPAPSSRSKRLHFTSLATLRTSNNEEDLSEPENDLDTLVKGEDEDEEGVAEKVEDEEEQEEEEEGEEEDQFADDMEGDYNAEQYFDSGAGEDWDDDGGGDDGGWF